MDELVVLLFELYYYLYILGAVVLDICVVVVVDLILDLGLGSGQAQPLLYRVLLTETT